MAEVRSDEDGLVSRFIEREREPLHTRWGRVTQVPTPIGHGSSSCGIRRRVRRGGTGILEHLAGRRHDAT